MTTTVALAVLSDFAHNRPTTPEVQALIDNPEALPDHDAVLAGVVAQANVVLDFVLTGDAAGSPPGSGASPARDITSANRSTPARSRGGSESLPGEAKLPPRLRTPPGQAPKTNA